MEFCKVRPTISTISLGCLVYYLSVCSSDERDHKNVLDAIEKYRKKADVLSDAVISIELDNSRAGLKIFSDLRSYSPVSETWKMIFVNFE